MGNFNDHQIESEIPKNMVIQKRIYDERFEDVQIVHNISNGQDLAMKEILCSNKEEFNFLMVNMENRKKLVHPNIIQLIDVYNKTQMDLCNSAYRIDMLFEYTPFYFSEEINKRAFNPTSIYEQQASNKYFSESTLWNLLAQVVNGMAALQSRDMSSYNLNPQNIFIFKSAQQGGADSYKVCEYGLLGTQTLYMKALQMVQSFGNTNIQPPVTVAGLYLSPRLMQALSQREAQPIHISSKTDVFGLGMTMLHAASLITSNDCYDFKNGTISQTLITTRLNGLKERYSSDLVDMIGLMLTMDETQRPTFLEIKDKIFAFQTKYSTISRSVSPVQNNSEVKTSQIVKAQSPVKVQESIQTKSVPFQSQIIEQPQFIKQDYVKNIEEQLRDEKEKNRLQEQRLALMAKQLEMEKQLSQSRILSGSGESYTFKPTSYYPSVQPQDLVRSTLIPDLRASQNIIATTSQQKVNVPEFIRVDKIQNFEPKYESINKTLVKLGIAPISLNSSQYAYWNEALNQGQYDLLTKQNEQNQATKQWQSVVPSKFIPDLRISQNYVNPASLTKFGTESNVRLYQSNQVKTSSNQDSLQTLTALGKSKLNPEIDYIVSKYLGPTEMKKSQFAKPAEQQQNPKINQDYSRQSNFGYSSQNNLYDMYSQGEQIQEAQKSQNRISVTPKPLIFMNEGSQNPFTDCAFDFQDEKMMNR